MDCNKNVSKVDLRNTRVANDEKSLSLAQTVGTRLAAAPSTARFGDLGDHTKWRGPHYKAADIGIVRVLCCGGRLNRATALLFRGQFAALRRVLPRKLLADVAGGATVPCTPAAAHCLIGICIRFYKGELQTNIGQQSRLKTVYDQTRAGFGSQPQSVLIAPHIPECTQTTTTTSYGAKSLAEAAYRTTFPLHCTSIDQQSN